MNKPNNYQHWELDLDGCYYRFDDRDVYSFDSSVSKRIYNMFMKVRKLIKQYLYIKWNAVYFTFKGIKYSFTLSYSDDEVNYYSYVRGKLLKYGCTDIVFDSGVLD